MTDEPVFLRIRTLGPDKNHQRKKPTMIMGYYLLRDET